MNRNDFIEKMTKKLRDNHVRDIEEIISEYEEHFAFKLADGYSEEEIAAKLGNPDALAEQFISGTDDKKSAGKKAITVTGLVFTDIFAGIFFILLFAWEVVMCAVSIASAAIGVCLAGRVELFSLIPHMPYFSGVIFAVSLIALSVLSIAGSVYFAAFIRQLMKAYGRFHHNCIASAGGKAVLPSLASYPQLSPKFTRKLRKTLLISLVIFALCVILGYIVSAISAGALGFWHKWNWFVS